MSTVKNRSWLDWSIVVGCLIFIGVLALSGYVERDVLILHVLQSLIYVTVIWLSLQHSKWGYAIGISIAFRAGFRQWGLLFHGKAVTNLVQFSAPIAWFDHLALIVLLVLAYMRLDDRRWSDALRMLGALAGTFVYFAAIIALTWPQFIPRLRAHFGL